MKNRETQTGATSVLLLQADDDIAMLAELHLDNSPNFELVDRASTALEALSSAALYGPDLVLVDRMVPDGDAADAIGMLRGIVPHAVFIVTSTADTPRERIIAAHAGADGFVDVSKLTRLPELLTVELASVDATRRVDAALRRAAIING